MAAEGHSNHRSHLCGLQHIRGQTKWTDTAPATLAVTVVVMADAIRTLYYEKLSLQVGSECFVFLEFRLVLTVDLISL